MSLKINILLEFVEFSYVESEGGVYRPCVSVTFHNGKKKFPVGHALVDTGADFTILPLAIAHYLQIELDDTKQRTVDGAGGGKFKVIPSRNKINYSIDKEGFRSLQWKGIAYFTETEPIVLLGREQCLDKFDITFCGPHRLIQLIPHF